MKASDGTSVALSKFEGKSPVVVFFYPKVIAIFSIIVPDKMLT